LTGGRISPMKYSDRVVGLVAVVVALGVGACGEQALQEADANDVAEAFWRALSEGDPDAACESASSAFSGLCREQAATVSPAPPYDFAEPEATRSEINGDEATIFVCSGSDPRRRAEFPTPLVAEDGEWRIVGFAVSLEPPEWGCSNGGGSEPTKSDLGGDADPAKEAAVRSVVAEFIRARASGDAKRTCSLLTPDARNIAEPSSCVDLFGALGPDSKPTAQRRARRVLTSPGFTEVDIADSNATVMLRSPIGAEIVFELVEIDGVWLIDVPGRL
jgi:hypothetical protein